MAKRIRRFKMKVTQRWVWPKGVTPCQTLSTSGSPAVVGHVEITLVGEAGA